MFSTEDTEKLCDSSICLCFSQKQMQKGAEINLCQQNILKQKTETIFRPTALSSISMHGK